MFCNTEAGDLRSVMGMCEQCRVILWLLTSVDTKWGDYSESLLIAVWLCPTQVSRCLE